MSMYYLTEIEFLKLRENLMQSYSYQIDENLRGWSWNKPPLNVPYSDIFLSAWEFSSICPNYRDIYIRRKYNIRTPPSIYQIIGFLVHKLVQKIFLLAKKEIFNGNISNLYEKLNEHSENIINSTLKENPSFQKLKEKDQNKIRDLLKNITSFEIRRISTKVEEIKSNFPFLNTESLIFRSIPVNPELTVDGSLIGFSKILRVDAFGVYGNIVYDIKFGRPSDRHKLQLAVYALSIEANFMIPINVGIIVYVSSNNQNSFTINREIFIIDDYLRSRTIELRDEIMDALSKEKIPPMPKKCSNYCLLKDYCNNL